MSRFYWIAVAVLMPYLANAQEVPRELDQFETGPVLYHVQNQKFPSASGTLVISGERQWSSFFLAADRIEFEPGAKLIFTPEAIAERGMVYILANQIISQDQEKPGMISWRANPLSTPPDRGSAPGVGGYPGDEVQGNPGTNGGTGNQGYPGNSAPDLTLVLAKPDSPVIIDLSGQDGGQGGQGETGGRGGVGGNGNQASQGGFDCKRGAGNGASGGKGGAGGQGGTGGTGGSGGKFTVITVPDSLPIASTVLRVRLSPGIGGVGGKGGEPGPGGTGGQGGKEALPWCRGDGANGVTGPNGATGSTGLQGSPGSPGDYIVGGVSVTDINKVLKP